MGITFQLRSLAVGFLAIGSALSGVAQPADVPPPKELVQYIHEAKRQGVAEAKIQQDAVEAGWSAAAVHDAMAYDNRTGGGPQSSSPGVTASFEIPPSTTRPVESKAASPSSTAPGHTTEPKAVRPAGVVPDDYRIGAGDTLQISVWKEPDASIASIVVRPDGRISMPLLKEIDVAGLTPRELEQAITEKLSKFINAADVTVVVLSINSKKIYVVGAARKEGPLAYTYRMTVVQALSEAGGLTDYAKRKKIYILRTENGKEYQLPFNYDDVIKGQRTEQNIELLPGDTIIIPH